MTDDRSILCSFCFSREPALYSLSMVRILRSQWNRSRHTVREEGGKLGPVSQHSSARDHTGETLGDPRDRACLEEERLRAAGGWQASSAEATGLGPPVLWHWFIQKGGRGCGWEGDGEQTAVTLMSRWGEPGGSGARLPRGPSSCWHREARQEEGSEASLTEERRRDSRSGQWRVQVSDARSGSMWITCRHRLRNAPPHGVQSSYCRENEWQSQQN